jgi:hypothetical protein
MGSAPDAGAIPAYVSPAVSPAGAPTAAPATASLATLKFESSDDDDLDDLDVDDSSDDSDDEGEKRDPFDMTQNSRSNRKLNVLSGLSLFVDAPTPILSKSVAPGNYSDPIHRQRPLQLPLERILVGVVMLAILCAMAPASWGL